MATEYDQVIFFTKETNNEIEKRERGNLMEFWLRDKCNISLFIAYKHFISFLVQLMKIG